MYHGKTGWTTIYALLHTLQIELRITATADNFSPSTIAKFSAKYPNGVQRQENDESLTLPEMFFKYFMSKDAITGKSYLEKRTMELLNKMGTYNTFFTTVIHYYDIFPYPKLKGILVSSEAKYKQEFEMASITFLNFIENKSIKESH